MKRYDKPKRPPTVLGYHDIVKNDETPSTDSPTNWLIVVFYLLTDRQTSKAIDQRHISVISDVNPITIITTAWPSCQWARPLFESYSCLSLPFFVMLCYPTCSSILLWNTKSWKLVSWKTKKCQTWYTIYCGHYVICIPCSTWKYSMISKMTYMAAG